MDLPAQRETLRVDNCNSANQLLRVVLQDAMDEIIALSSGDALDLHSSQPILNWYLDALRRLRRLQDHLWFAAEAIYLDYDNRIIQVQFHNIQQRT